jgi:hypothetical protein
MALIFKSIFKEINSLAVKLSISGLTITAAIILNIVFFEKITREKEMLHDIDVMCTVVPKDETVLMSNSLASEYSLRSYMSRLADITLTTIDDGNKYLIMPKEEAYDEQKWQSKY